MLKNLDSEERAWVKAGIGIVVLILFLITKPFVVVDAGTTGIVYSFGSIVGQLDEGFHIIPPWHFVTHTNVRVQREVMEKLQSFSKETQEVFVRASLNYQVNPRDIQNLFRRVGRDYYHVLIEPRVAQLFKDETVKYNTTDVAPNREKIRQVVREKLENELKAYSIHVVDLLLDNIDFDPAFKQAILNKQIASQKALEEEQNIRAATNKAAQVIETERGVGEAANARADKLALANTKLANSITPALLQYEAIKKWDGKRPMVEGAGSGLILQLPK